MQVANQQKVIIGVSILAVVALLSTTLLTRTDFSYSQQKDQVAANKDAQEKSLAEYRAYLATLKVDPVASSLILNKVIDTEQVRNNIEADLGANQPVFKPIVQESRFQISGDDSKEAVSTYATKAIERVSNFYNSTNDNWDSVLTAQPDPVLAQKAADGAKQLVSDLYQMPVPPSAVGMHRAVLASALIQQNLVNNSNNVVRGVQPRGAQWKIAPNFVASTTEYNNMKAEAEKLTAKYGLIQADSTLASGSLFMKTAQAAAPVFVVNPVLPVGVLWDIPRMEEQFLRSLLGTLVLNFIKEVIVTLVEKLEKNFTVANFLYYTDAVINTKYANDYLKKYVGDTDDQEMVKKFLPQFNCGTQNSEQLKKTLRAKAVEYLGYDPNIPLDTTSPKFWSDLSKTGDLQGDEPGYQRLYKALAVVTESQATQAATLEQTSATGKKSPLGDSLDQGISKSVDYISNKVQAALNALFNIAPVNATTGGPGFSAVVVNVVLGIINLLAVKGATIKEQSACVEVPVLNPIVMGDYGTQGEALAGVCLKPILQVISRGVNALNIYIKAINTCPDAITDATVDIVYDGANNQNLPWYNGGLSNLRYEPNQARTSEETYGYDSFSERPVRFYALTSYVYKGVRFQERSQPVQFVEY